MYLIVLDVEGVEGQVQQPTISHEPRVSVSSIARELNELAILHDVGLLAPLEYERRRVQVLTQPRRVGHALSVVWLLPIVMAVAAATGGNWTREADALVQPESVAVPAASCNSPETSARVLERFAVSDRAAENASPAVQVLMAGDAGGGQGSVTTGKACSATLLLRNGQRLPVTFTLDRFELTAIGTREPAPAAAKPVS